MQVRDAVHFQALRKLAAEEIAGMVERQQGLLRIRFTRKSNPDVGMMLVRRDLDIGDHDTAHARVGHFVFDEFGKLLAERFRDAFCAMIHG